LDLDEGVARQGMARQGGLDKTATNRGIFDIGIERQKTQFDPVWRVLSQVDANRHEHPTVAEVIARRVLQEGDRLAYLKALAEPGQCGDQNIIAARRHVAMTLLECVGLGEEEV